MPLPPGQPIQAGAASTPSVSRGYASFQEGETALKAHDRDRAYQCFHQAAAYINELDQATAQRLQSHLQLLSVPTPPPPPGPMVLGRDRGCCGAAAGPRAAVGHRVGPPADGRPRHVGQGSENIAGDFGARADEIETADLDPQVRDAMLRSIGRSLAETQQYIQQNRPRIELAEKNNRTRQEIEHDLQSKYERQEKIAVMVNDFNRLMDEQRYAEAEVLAKRAAELDPRNPVVEQLNLRANCAQLLRQQGRQAETTRRLHEIDAQLRRSGHSV